MCRMEKVPGHGLCPDLSGPGRPARSRHIPDWHLLGKKYEIEQNKRKNANLVWNSGASLNFTLISCCYPTGFPYLLSGAGWWTSRALRARRSGCSSAQIYVLRTQYGHGTNVWQTLKGPLFVLSKTIKLFFLIICWDDLQNVRQFASLESRLETTKNALKEHHPDINSHRSKFKNSMTQISSNLLAMFANFMQLFQNAQHNSSKYSPNIWIQGPPWILSERLTSN